MADEKKPRRTRRLSDDEHALWQHAARTMTPLRRAKSRVHPAAAEHNTASRPHETLPTAQPAMGTDADRTLFEAAAGIRATPPKQAPEPRSSDRRADASNQPIAPPPPGAAGEQPAKPRLRAPSLPPYAPPVSRPRQVAGSSHLTSFDSKSARRLKSGRLDIGARLDLHGMRQDEARAALVSFLRSAQTRGHRYVLVITGKGLPRRLSASFDDGDPPEPWTGQPGVLRRNVPVWLASPDLSTFVVSYTEAAPQHGGSGAIYVQVRSR